jgi:uncharacterized protein
MTIGIYEVTIPPFIHGLKTLSALLEKGQSHASADEASLLEARLIDDMAALPYQIQRISDTAKGCAVRVGKAEPVPMEDNEKTFPELQARIAKTIEVLEKVDPKVMDSMEDGEVVMKLSSGDKKFIGKEYVLKIAIPNFYFHLCMAYAILRKEGVPVGKRDYLGAH